MSEIQVIDVGAAPDDDSGDSLRLMAQKVNESLSAIVEMLNLRAAALHSHSQADVVGLVAALAEKATTAYVNSQISTVSGSVTSETAARVAADDALDARLDVVEAWKTTTTSTLSSHGSRLTAAEAAIDALEASVTGVDDFSGRVTTIEGKRGSLLENADGAFTGTELMTGATDRDGIVIQTDKFGVKSVGSALLVPFETSGGISYLKQGAIRARDLSQGETVAGTATVSANLTTRTGSLVLLMATGWGSPPSGTNLVIEDITAGAGSPTLLASVPIYFVSSQALPAAVHVVVAYGAGAKVLRARFAVAADGSTPATGFVRLSVLEVCR